MEKERLMCVDVTLTHINQVLELHALHSNLATLFRPSCQRPTHTLFAHLPRLFRVHGFRRVRLSNQSLMEQTRENHLLIFAFSPSCPSG